MSTHDNLLHSQTASLDDNSSPVERLLLRVVDTGLAGCILIVPWLMGGRHPLGQLVLVVLAVTVTMAWIARACLAKDTPWRASGGEVVLLAAVGLLILQWVPLPDRILSILSPRLSEMLPLWSADAEATVRPGRWSQVSLAPAATGACLVMLLAYGMLFWVTLQRIRTVGDVERLLRWCGWAVLGMAGFALVQLLFSNGKFFWFHEAQFSHTSDVAKGSFTNPNHLAHFLALGIGALIWSMQDRLSRRHTSRIGSSTLQHTGETPVAPIVLSILGLGVVLFAGMLSLSRGGMVVMVLSVAIMIFVCRRAKVLSPRLTAAMLGTAAVVVAALTIYGFPAIGHEMDSLVSGSVETLDPGQRRRVVWTADLHAAKDFPILGTGAGTHRWVCPSYLDPEQLSGASALAGRIYFTHAENGFLQTAVETGIAGLLLLLSGVGLVGYWCIAALRRADSRRTLMAAGALCAILAVSLVHSMVDFVWHVPACMAIVAIFAACVCRLSQLSHTPEQKHQRLPLFHPRHAWVGLSLMVVVGGWMVGNRVGPVLAEAHWQNNWHLARDSAVDAEEAQITSYQGDKIIIQAQPLEKPLRQIIGELEEVVRLDPTRAEARLQLAGSYLLLFEYRQQQSTTNTMPLASIREAAIASHFSSRAELNTWLKAALGEKADYLELARRHTRRALQTCPLLGAGYLYLGQLSFLEGAQSRKPVRQCVAQALRVRPFDGQVLVSAGQEAVIDRSMAQAIDYWQRAYRLGPVYRRALVRRLAGHVCPEAPSSDLDFFLDTFEPELETVRQLEVIYAALAPNDQIARLRDRHAQLARAEAEQCNDSRTACRLWMEARLAHVKRGQADAAIACLRKAVECDPTNATARRRLGLGLLEQTCYAEASSHLQWCLARDPEDRSLLAALRKCTRNQIKLNKRSTIADRNTSKLR